MTFVRNPFALLTCLGLVAFAALIGTPLAATAQVRTKKPDRGVYQPPLIEDAEADSLSGLIRADGNVGFQEAPRRQRQQRPIRQTPAKWGAPLVDADLTDARKPMSRSKMTGKRTSAQQKAKSKHVASAQPQLDERTKLLKSEPIQLAPPHRPQRVGEEVVIAGGEEWVAGGEIYYETDSYAPVPDPTCGVCDGCDACGSACDSIGSCKRNSWRDHANAYLSLAPDRWFASADLMLMFRKGDGLPPLVTTGDSTRQEFINGAFRTLSNEDQAGELGQDDTRVLAGDELIFKDMTAGGRLSIGTWLDCRRCRSLVARGWFAGEQRYRFFADQDVFPVLARPFRNLTDGEDEADALLIAFPEVEIDDPDNEGETIIVPARAIGSVSVLGDSNVYGGDVSLRQLWYGKYGGTVDILYGYQYMGMQENLAIGSISTSLDEDFAPVGSVITIRDSFDVRNDFHGAQVGLASAYREGCWSFRGLFKLGFGGLRRRAKLMGQTTTSVDGETAFDPNGLLVRSTNAGLYSDTEFAWSPELNLTLGWQYFPLFDVTFGYHLAALTDALQVSNTIDPNLAVNFDPDTGPQRPAAVLRYSTYYVQGIHFGIQYVY